MVKILITDGIEKAAAQTLEGLGFDITDMACSPDKLKKQINRAVWRPFRKSTR